MRIIITTLPRASVCGCDHEITDSAAIVNINIIRNSK